MKQQNTLELEPNPQHLITPPEECELPPTLEGQLYHQPLQQQGPPGQNNQEVVSDAMLTQDLEIQTRQKPQFFRDSNNFFDQIDEMSAAVCPQSPGELSVNDDDEIYNQTTNQLEQFSVSNKVETRQRFDSIFGQIEEQPQKKPIIFKAQKQEEFSFENNPFTKNLIQRLGPEFNPKNLINKNKKMFQNLQMLDGFAFCAEDDEYEHTYLDRIKIEQEIYLDNNKPVHIDKLFENEDAFLDDPMEQVEPLKRSAVCSTSFKSEKNRIKLKRQRINSGNTSEEDVRVDHLSEIKKLNPSKINLKQILSDEQKLQSNLMLALKKSMPPDFESLDPNATLLDFSLNFVKNFMLECTTIQPPVMPQTPCQSSLGSEQLIKQIAALDEQSRNTIQLSGSINTLCSNQTKARPSIRNLVMSAIQSLPEKKGSKQDIINEIQRVYGNQENLSVFIGQIGQSLSKNFQTLGNSYQLLLKNTESGNCETLKDMIIQTMAKFSDKIGTIDDILGAMITHFGKDKVCENTNQTLLSFDEHENPAAIKNVKQKIQKVMSRYKDTIFRVHPVQYTLKDEKI